MIWLLDWLASLFAPDLIRARAERDAALKQLAALEADHRRLLDAIDTHLTRRKP